MHKNPPKTKPKGHSWFAHRSIPLRRRHTRARLSPRSRAAARCSGSGWAVTRSPDCQAPSQRRSSSHPVALLHTHLTSSGCRPCLVRSCKTSSEFLKSVNLEGGALPDYASAWVCLGAATRVPLTSFRTGCTNGNILKISPRTIKLPHCRKPEARPSRSRSKPSNMQPSKRAPETTGRRLRSGQQVESRRLSSNLQPWKEAHISRRCRNNKVFSSACSLPIGRDAETSGCSLKLFQHFSQGV